MVELFSIAHDSKMPVFTWSVTAGFTRIDKDNKSSLLEATRGCSRSDSATQRPGLYLLLDFHPYLDDSDVRMLKEIALNYKTLGHTVLWSAMTLNYPAAQGALRGVCVACQVLRSSKT